MKIFNPSGIEIYDIVVDDSSVRYRSIMAVDNLTLKLSAVEPISIPLFSYVDFEGGRYTLYYPGNFKKIHTRNFEYTLVLHAYPEAMKMYIYKDLSVKPYRVKFQLTATPDTFLQLLVDVMNVHDTGWVKGNVIATDEKLISFNSESCYDVLNRIAQEFDTEWEVIGKTIHLNRIEKFKADPLALSYGKGNGFVSGVGRINSGDRQPWGRMYVQGGEKNIDYSQYLSKTLLLPKSATVVVEEKTYRTDADGMYITRDGNQNKAEGSFDGSHFYPKRVGSVTAVEVIDAEKHFYDIIDTNIPATLDYSQQRIAGEKATIVFQSGALAGREFDIEQTDADLTGYIHAERRFKIVPAELDGYIMPGGVFVPAVGDKYAVFNIRMPGAYISDDATQSGASWDMFREAIKVYQQEEEQKFSFTGQLDGIWSRSKWLEVGGKIVPGGHVLFSDPQFQPDGILIRITAVKDYVNKPHKPEITLCNAPISGSFSSGLGKLEAEEVVRESDKKDLIRYSKRQWRDTKETMSMLHKDLETWASETEAGLANTDQAVTDLNTYVDGAFRDEIVETADAKAIEKYINQINKEKSELGATYNKLYANPLLCGDSKDNLLNAKITLFGDIDSLISAINTAISDGKTTSAEKTQVDNAFATYRDSLAVFRTRGEEARQSIEQAIKSVADSAQNTADSAQNTAASAQAAANTAAAITDKFGTTSDGGLISTVMVLLRELNSTQNTAGISGIQKDINGVANQPSFWSGGSYAQALGLIEFMHHMAAGTPAGTDTEAGQFDYAAKYDDLAKTTTLHNGAGKYGDFIVEESGRIVVVDPATGLPRLVFSVQDIPTIADLMSSTVFGEKIDVSGGSVSFNSRSEILSNSTEITQDSSKVTFGGTTIYIAGTGRKQDNGMASVATVSIYARRNGVRYSCLASESIQFVSSSGSDEFIQTNIPLTHRTFSKGTYDIELVLDVDGNVSNAEGHSYATTFEWTFTQQNVRRQQYGKDGMMFFYSDRHFHYTEGKGLDLRGPTNMPGVLLSASVGVNGGWQDVWGPKQSSTPPPTPSPTGRYTINHTIGHTKYQVSCFSNTENRSFRVYAKNVDSVVIECRTIGSNPALTNSPFDITLYGNNYK